MLIFEALSEIYKISFYCREEYFMVSFWDEYKPQLKWRNEITFLFYWQNKMNSNLFPVMWVTWMK